MDLKKETNGACARHSLSEFEKLFGVDEVYLWDHSRIGEADVDPEITPEGVLYRSCSFLVHS